MVLKAFNVSHICMYSSMKIKLVFIVIVVAGEYIQWNNFKELMVLYISSALSTIYEIPSNILCGSATSCIKAKPNCTTLGFFSRNKNSKFSCIAHNINFL